MSPSRSRYVTACQQLLALAVVLAGLVPAAAVVSLDVIRETPASGAGGVGPGAGEPVADPAAPVVDEVAAAGQRRSRALARDRRAAERSRATAEVPTTDVEPTVTEVPLEEQAPGTRPEGERRTTSAPGAGRDQVTSAPQPVTGYGAVGVTWAAGTDLHEDDIAVEVRTRTDGAWSGWTPMEYHDEHGPDPDSPEAAGTRPGTDEALVGHVDDVQVRVESDGDAALPADLSLAVIDPGSAGATDVEAPALVPEEDVSGASGSSSGEGLALRAAATQAAPPTIYSRAQWGADESLRDQSAPRYGSIKGGFVHHTVNANDYTADEVPGIIRSIYAYHVKSRGWRDIGYNFLVDRFGRIWEGRWGGVDRPVEGAHTSGYNDEAFAMSAIGNFDVAQPTPELLDAYGRLFAWKLAISGVSASATNVPISGTTFASSIMGHRDAGQTACPGRYLYAQLPAIRQRATQAQAGLALGPAWSGRTLSSDLVGSGWPDLVVRRAADGRGVLLPTGGLTRYAGPARISGGWRDVARVQVSHDLTGDGRADVLVVGRNGVPRVRPGTGTGKVKGTKNLARSVRGYAQVWAVGDLDRDGRGDLAGRTSAGRLVVLHGQQGRRFTTAAVKGSWKGFDLVLGAGDLTGDGRDDVAARDRKGRLFLFPGTRKGLGKKIKVPGRWGRYDAIVGGGDHDGDGRDDLVVRQGRSGDVFVLPGTGGGRVAAAIGPVARLDGPDQLSAGLLGPDGRADLVARRGNQLVRLTNLGSRELGAPVETDLDLSGATAVLNAGDLDGDGRGDVVVRDAAGTLTLRPGNGGASFGAPVVLGTGFGAVTGLVAVADRTGDGRPDLAGYAGGVATVWPGAGRGPLGVGAADPGWSLVPSGTDLSGLDWVVPVSDADGDGRPDVLVRRPATGQLLLLPGEGAGVGAPRTLASGLGGYDLGG